MTEDAADLVKTTVRLRRDLHNFVSDRVHDLKRGRQKASLDGEVNRAVEAYRDSIEGGAKPEVTTGPAYPAEIQEWIDRLLNVLNSGDPDATRAVQSNLILFDNHVRMLKRQRAVRSERRQA